MLENILFIRCLGICTWQSTYHKMHQFTNNRNKDTNDEIWFVEHPAIFTQGRIIHKKNLLVSSTNIPLVTSDRGGQITYHGPGQQIMYVLIDIKRRKFNLRKFVKLLEKTVINTLLYYDIKSHSYPNEPGIYVGQRKICSIGLRIHKGCSLHGLALNVKMNLTPFLYINPCGKVGMQMTQLSEFNPKINICEVKFKLAKNFINLAEYDEAIYSLLY